MPDGSRRSREFWTDTMEAGPPSPPAHVHRLPKFVRFALAGLLVAVSLLLVAVGFLTVYVYQANQYVQGRGEYRDEETARLEEQIRESICDLLDQLPEGGLLDAPREKYHCGPGIPLEDLPADLRRRYTGEADVPMGSSAAIDPPRATPFIPPPDADPDRPVTAPEEP